MSKPDWEHVGNIGVDAGLCWVGDPCYCVTPDADSHPAKTWGEFCEKLDKVGNATVVRFTYKGEARPAGIDENDGLGVVVSTGYGDGKYPVFVRKNKEGRVIEVKVVFSDEFEEKDDYLEEECEDEKDDFCPDCGSHNTECACPICTQCGLKENNCLCSEFTPTKQNEEESE